MMNNTLERLLVVVDPADRAGEAGLAEATATLARGGSVTVMTFLSDSPALRDLAQSEGISKGEAADIYLAQIAERFGDAVVDTLSSLGADMVSELVAAIGNGGFTKLAIPATTAGRLRAAIADIATWADIPVVVAPGRRSAA